MDEVLSGNAVSHHGNSEILQRQRFVSVVVFLAGLAVLVAGWMVKGDVEAAVRPDSDDFVRAGRAIMSWIANGGAGFQAVQSHPVFPHYFIPSVVLAAIYTYFSDPVVKVVALNAVLYSVIVVLMYQFWTTIHGAWSRWTGRQGFVAAGLGGFYIIFGLPDPFLLSYTVLTDIIFLFWVSVFVVAAGRGILQGGWMAWILALFMAVSALYVRPTGIVLPVLFLYAVLVKLLSDRGVGARSLAVASIGAPLVIALMIVPWLVSMKINGAAWVDAVVPDLLRPEFTQAVYFFKKGIVVSNRLETYVGAAEGYTDVLRMILQRMLYYWIPLRLGEAPYTLTHNIVNLVYVLAIWPLMIIGIRRMTAADRRCRIAALFLVMVALSYALLHSVTLLSFGWRYQLPAMVPLWMLAGIGLFSLLGRPVLQREPTA